ncbi:DUF4376 domain-containing protein [Salibacterium sp. K-3]
MANLSNSFVSATEQQEQELSSASSRKIRELKEQCTAAIHAGFSITIGNTEYTLGMKEHDQNNLTQMNLRLVQKKNQGETLPEEVRWKKLNNGVVSFTPEQFFSVITASENHKLDRATTKEEIEAVTW